MQLVLQLTWQQLLYTVKRLFYRTEQGTQTEHARTSSGHSLSDEDG